MSGLAGSPPGHDAHAVGHDGHAVQGGLPVEEDDVAVLEVALDHVPRPEVGGHAGAVAKLEPGARPVGVADHVGPRPR